MTGNVVAAVQRAMKSRFYFKGLPDEGMSHWKRNPNVTPVFNGTWIPTGATTLSGVIPGNFGVPADAKGVWLTGYYDCAHALQDLIGSAGDSVPSGEDVRFPKVAANSSVQNSGVIPLLFGYESNVGRVALRSFGTAGHHVWLYASGYIS